jgi:CRISPR-associated endonuclease/helicase Cas3
MLPEIYAHSLPDEPLKKWERLSDHLTAVATRAAEFASIFGFGEIARLAGRLHDAGKLSPEFQAYIRNERVSGGDHSTAGASIAWKGYAKHPPFATALAAIIAAHHAGLANGADLRNRLREAGNPPPDWPDVVGALPPVSALVPTQQGIPSEVPGFAECFLTRMLFSCLVDADFLETERFYVEAEGNAVQRGHHAPLEVLRDRLRAHMAKTCARAEASSLNTLRAEILSHTVAKATLAPGLFTLTVPTGGGKTLASLSFALDHAVQHGLRRVIYVIPYTSIIEQTASVFRGALDAPDDILEHHASFDWDRTANSSRDDEGPNGLAKLRRAAENWDVPIVVTTAVQFFESLFANRTSRCRKLHNIAGSVVIFDEAQTLPIPLLLPCLAALDELARNYHVSAVLCTATQPAIRKTDGLKAGLDIDAERELAPNPQRLYTALKRVAVERMPEPITDQVIAGRFAEQPQMLCIVNSRKHAQVLFSAVQELPGATHLTTLMCPRHRRKVLEEVRRRLKQGAPVRLVATSLIEAGVDVDFPEVWRAAAGLESIAQAAGRCNREGKLTAGRVVVFDAAEQKPPHEMMQRWQAAEAVFRHHPADDLLGLDAVRTYFRELYWVKGDDALDAAMVQDRRGILPAIKERAGTRDFPFVSIAQAFRMIDEVMQPVIVPWREDNDDQEAESLLARIAVQDRPSSADLRKLQQYIVPIPERDRAVWLAAGVLVPVHPKLGDAMLKFADLAHYDTKTGVGISNIDFRLPEANVIS